MKNIFVDAQNKSFSAALKELRILCQHKIKVLSSKRFFKSKGMLNQEKERSKVRKIIKSKTKKSKDFKKF